MQLQAKYPALLSALRDARLDTDRLEPWAAWKVFKAALRQPLAPPATQAGYVEFGAGREQDGFWHLTLVLQLASWEPKLSGPTRHRDDQGTGLDLNVVRELVMDLAFELEVAPSRERRELAEGDFVDLDLFVAAVESDANFQTAMAAECIGSLVYEQEL